MSADRGTGERAAMLASTPPARSDAAVATRDPRRRALVIRPRRGWRLPDFAELWRYRELFWVLSARDLRVRYKQTVLGMAWAFVQPFFTMIVFTMIGRFGSFSSEGVPRPVFYFCALLPWLLFANAMTAAGNSLLASQSLIMKVYFPRIVIPVASAITALVDFAMAFAVLLAMMLYYRMPLRPQLVLVPFLAALAFFMSLAFGVGLSALTARFRDVRHVVPFVTQMWLLCTPVLYSSAVVGGGKRILLDLNPMSGVVEGFRWCVLGRPAPGLALALSCATTLVVAIASLYYFQDVERSLADRL